MKALSIRQPWAWLIIHGGKDIENRTWPTKFRGRFLVHASQTMTRHDYEGARGVALAIGGLDLHDKLPAPQELLRGGTIGSVELVDSVTSSPSRWYMGGHGFVLRDPVALPFQPLKGRLGFFEVPA